MNIDDIIFADLVNAPPEIKNTLNIIKTNIDLSFDSPKFIYDKRICATGTYSRGDVNHVEYTCNRETILILPENADDNRYALYWEIPNNTTIRDVIEDTNITREGKIIPLKLLCKKDGILHVSDIKASDYYYYFHTGWLDAFPTRLPLEEHQWDNTWSNSFMTSSTFDEETLLSVATTVPMYNNYAEAVEYINTGQLGLPINSDINDDESPEQVNYYYNMELYRTRGSYNNATLFKTVKLDFNMSPKARVSGYITDFVPYNVNISQEHTGKYIDGVLTVDDVEQRYGTYNDLISNANTTLAYTEEDSTLKVDGWYYFTNVKTNIPIFGSEDDSNRYYRNEIDKSVAKIGNTDEPNESRTGDKLTNTENTQADITSQMTTVYVVEKSSLDAIASDLYTTDDNIFEAMQHGLRMLGQNMIDTVCGLYVTPIDVNQFLTNRHLKDIYIGSYKTNGVGIVGSNNKTVVLCNTYIAPIYNNYLDFSNVFLSVFLPGCGIVPLDSAVFIGNYLKIEVAFDIRTHSMKYYIKMSNTKAESIIEMHEGSIGADMPITGANQIEKTRQLQGAFASVVDSIGKMASRDIVGGAMSVYGSIASINQAPSIKQSGGTSSGVSCFDPMFPYLIIDTQVATIPVNLYAQYGYPTNTIVKLSTCRGWTEASDIKLTGNMLSEEKALIKSAFVGGVVL